MTNIILHAIGLPATPIPVNSPWALLVLILAMLGLALASTGKPNRGLNIPQKLDRHFDKTP